jgi:glycosyltransferase involved in cell wall biosynthesis
MKYNLVLQDKNWVIEKLANHFAEHIEGSKVSDYIDMDADVNFYFNWHGFRNKTRFDVCLFTHIEDRRWWDEIVKHCNVAVLIGNKYLDTVPEDKRVVFNPPPFNNFLPQEKIKVLVVGRSYGSGRKNFELANMVDKLPNIQVTFTEGKMSEEQLKSAYKNTDYVLVTSKIESGPICVVEAMAMKKPVIAPDVGLCWEYPVIRYSTDEDLVGVFEKISTKDNAWNTEVKKVTDFVELKFPN